MQAVRQIQGADTSTGNLIVSRFLPHAFVEFRFFFVLRTFQDEQRFPLVLSHRLKASPHLAFTFKMFVYNYIRAILYLLSDSKRGEITKNSRS